MQKLFEPVKPGTPVKKGPPPLVFVVTPDSYIEFKTPEEIKQWEEELAKRLGVTFPGHMGTRTESCSCCCSDDCDM